MRGMANVMCGQEGYYGTSSFNVVLDIDKLIHNQKALNIDANMQNENDEMKKAFYDEVNNTVEDKCSIDN